MTVKKFLLDDEPVTMRELFAAASAIDERFAEDWCKQTSVAASILRENGQDVKENPDFQLA